MMKTSNIAVTPINPHRWGDDLDVVNAARVSFNKESTHAVNMVGDIDGIQERDEKLIKYLAQHKHHSPFNHSFLSFRIKAPIFVARQLVKHKFMPWNEVSRRYVDEEPEFYVPDVWRGRSSNKKQGSDGVIEVRCDFPWVDYGSQGDFNQYLEICEGGYKSLLEKGVAPEQARMVLPQNTMTEWIWSGTLGAFCDMLVLRLDSHTQRETQEVAKLVAQHVKKHFPVTYKWRVENG